MEEPSDLELLRRLRGGDRAEREAAFGELHRRHARHSFQLAWRVLGDADLAADAVQEAFLTVWRKGAHFEERAQFSSWLFRVVLNRSIDLRRRERRVDRAGGIVRAGGAGSGLTGEHGGGRSDGGGSAGDEVPDPLAAVASGELGPEASARRSERDATLRQAIARLSPKLEEVVLLRYPGGLSYEEIGALLRLPPGTVRSRLNRAHAALRGILGTSLDDAVPENP
jgi:RNA polymerase sigma-70 factor (ECF subfamily)